MHTALKNQNEAVISCLTASGRAGTTATVNKRSRDPTNQLNIKVIDSFNHLPMALSKLSGGFSLTEIKKGYFPHLFNTVENQTYVGPYPDKKYYSPEFMTSIIVTPF